MSLFAQNPAQEFVKLHPSFLDQWEAVLEMTDTHNVTFETADGEVTAHDHILMATSPVLKAMLQSTMKEGSNKRVQIKDSPSAGASRWHFGKRMNTYSPNLPCGPTTIPVQSS